MAENTKLIETLEDRMKKLRERIAIRFERAANAKTDRVYMVIAKRIEKDMEKYRDLWDVSVALHRSSYKNLEKRTYDALVSKVG